MTTSKTTTGSDGSEHEMRAIVEGASSEAKAVLAQVLKLERDYLPQKNPSAAKLGREIAEIVRKVVT